MDLTIRALDIGDPVGDADGTSDTNLTNTTFEPRDPPVIALFVAPTSGQVLLMIGGGLQDNGGTNRIAMAPQVREGGPDGRIVYEPVISRNGWSNASVNAAYQYGGRLVLVPNLEPGRLYWAQVMLVVTGGSSADNNNANLFIIPSM